MRKNSSLHNAKKEKNDEFYTLYEDIEKEVNHYKEKIEGKVIYCNCDNYKISNFYRFFVDNFVNLKLKKVIITGFSKDKKAKKVVIEYIDNIVTETISSLKQNGDFRSTKCVVLLKEADIVISNPPFSLFREYFKMLTDNDKDFLIVGSLNAVTYKVVFKFIKETKVLLGYGKPLKFIIPSVELKNIQARWFTTLKC